MWGSRNPLLQFGDQPNISGLDEAKHFKFGTEIDDNKY